MIWLSAMRGVDEKNCLTLFWFPLNDSLISHLTTVAKFFIYAIFNVNTCFNYSIAHLEKLSSMVWAMKVID